MKNNIKLTSAGLETLKEELRVLVDEKRPKLVARLSNARQEGDLSENSDYQSAREELEFLDGRIDELNEVIKNAVVEENDSNGKVSVGAQVTVKVGGKDVVFNVVGEWEADPMNKKISHTSPLGSALMGKKVGDEVEVEAPAGKVLYKVVSIK